MKVILTLLLAVVLLATTRKELSGQDISKTTLTWTATHLTDLKTNKESAYSATFKTSGTADVIWIQKNGTFITTMKFKGIQGTWPNVSKNGSVTYSITLEGETGTIVFEKNEQGTFITLSVGTYLHHKYNVSTVTLKN